MVEYARKNSVITVPNLQVPPIYTQKQASVHTHIYAFIYTLNSTVLNAENKIENSGFPSHNKLNIQLLQYIIQLLHMNRITTSNEEIYFNCRALLLQTNYNFILQGARSVKTKPLKVHKPYTQLKLKDFEKLTCFTDNNFTISLTKKF